MLKRIKVIMESEEESEENEQKGEYKEDEYEERRT